MKRYWTELYFWRLVVLTSKKTWREWKLVRDNRCHSFEDKSGWSDLKKIASHYQIFGSALVVLLKIKPHDFKKNSVQISLRGMTNSDRSVWNWNERGFFSTKHPTHFQSVLFQKYKIFLKHFDFCLDNFSMVFNITYCLFF